MLNESTRAPMMRRLGIGYVLAAIGLAISPSTGAAQWSTAYEQFYLPGDFNWTFRNTYPGADRLFNAFDYGHAILYERLYTQPGADSSRLENTEYDFITKKLLVSPPRLPLEESAIEVAYVKLAPEAKMMFDWAHLLHRQIYDVLASERMSQTQKDSTIAELVSYYKTRPDLAFSSVPKSMDLMEGQPYSLVFRQKYPKFNGLIWGYHWLQVGLYEPLMVGTTLEERQAGVSAAVTRFKQMLQNAPEHMPRMMPMTAAIAPTFARRYPEAAIIFDNLHSMHDVVSDILASSSVPRDQKRTEILRAASRYRDATSFAMTPAEWMDMAQMMGIENMGGPAIGFLPGWPTPTVARGTPAAQAMQSMASMNKGGMAGMAMSADNSKGKDMTSMAMKPDSASKAMAGMSMPGMAMKPDSASKAMAGMSMPGMAMKSDSATKAMAGMSMPGMTMKSDSSTKAMAGMSMPGMQHGGMGGTADSSAMASMMTLFMQLTGDSIVRKRIVADTGLHRSLEAMIEQMPADHRAHMTMMMPNLMTIPMSAKSPSSKASPKTGSVSSTKTGGRPTPKKPATPATKKPDAMAGMAGMDPSMPGMKMPKKPDTTKAAVKRPPLA